MSPLDLPTTLLSTLPLDRLTLIESIPLPKEHTALPLKLVEFATLFVPPPPPPSSKTSKSNRGRNGPQLQLRQQEDDSGGSTWLVIQPERSKSQQAPLRGGGSGRRGASDDDTSSLSISIGPDNTVSVDSGRRRRVMG